MKTATLKVVVPHEVILGDFSFFMEAIFALVFFPNPYGQVVHKTITFSYKVKPHPNWASDVKDIGS